LKPQLIHRRRLLIQNNRKVLFTVMRDTGISSQRDWKTMSMRIFRGAKETLAVCGNDDDDDDDEGHFTVSTRRLILFIDIWVGSQIEYGILLIS
jgi:hypothetical protein